MDHRAAAALAALLLLAPATLAAAEPTGTWASEEGEIRVRIGRCGPALCGPIVWMQKPGEDVNNPNPELRRRSLLGVNLITGIRPDGEAWSGQIYNPEDGKTYAAKLRLLDQDTLELSGCVLAGLICKATRWSRVADPSPRPTAAR